MKRPLIFNLWKINFNPPQRMICCCCCFFVIQIRRNCTQIVNGRKKLISQHVNEMLSKVWMMWHTNVMQEMYGQGQINFCIILNVPFILLQIWCVIHSQCVCAYVIFFFVRVQTHCNINQNVWQRDPMMMRMRMMMNWNCKEHKSGNSIMKSIKMQSNGIGWWFKLIGINYLLDLKL